MQNVRSYEKPQARARLIVQVNFRWLYADPLLFELWVRDATCSRDGKSANPEALTAAHRALAFGTRVCGTNRRNPAPTVELFSWGSGQYCTTRLVNGPRLEHDRDAITRRPSRHLYFPRRRSAFQSERIQRACPPIGPHGRTGTMPHMRRGDFDQTDRTYECSRRRTPHVRMQAMPRATSIYRRSREPNCSCDATLTGWSPQSTACSWSPGRGAATRSARRRERPRAPRLLNSLATRSCPNAGCSSASVAMDLLDLLGHAILQHWLLAADLLQGQLAALS